MRNYEIYSIKKEIAYYFYRREQKIYQLFKEYQETEGIQREIFAKQIDYITEPIPAIAIHQQLIRHLQTRRDFKIHNEHYIIENKRGKALLKMFERKLTLQVSGAMDIDMIFLDILTYVEGYFLAIDLNQERFGWVKLVKENTVNI